jgi:hypothetical protein
MFIISEYIFFLDMIIFLSNLRFKRFQNLDGVKLLVEVDKSIKEMVYYLRKHILNSFCISKDSLYLLSYLDPIFICEACDAKSCYNCKVIWHEDLTCEGYQKKKSNQDFATEAYLSATKRCPSCGMYIEKIDKCDHMTCICSYQFCIS